MRLLRCLAAALVLGVPLASHADSSAPPPATEADDKESADAPEQSPSGLGPTQSAPSQAAPSQAAPSQAAPAASTWCIPELETLADDVCYAKGPLSKAGKRTLVIFLHGLVKDGSGWQHNMQRGMALAGKRLGFSVFVPKGRVGVRSDEEDKDSVAWPIAPKFRSVEDAVISEWQAARAFVEKREGAPFDEVFVLGFSNGAYYASSLALRGRLDVDGYGVFAGGSGASKQHATTKNRKPVFVGVASKDKTAKRGKELGKALKDLGWPHLVDSRPVGHVVADAHLDRALEFLREQKVAASTPPPPKAEEPTKKKPDAKSTKQKKKPKPEAAKPASKKKKKKS